ncbi:hypothetical protein [Labrys wisconsinensis]|uniref:Uncharacterized protein n=1 Tax=Labrys wisconsinensis TaxID=425677 RepID=A0ABU0JIL5_9HYPH|nr:hypothetical protein [Labrys wisconsinensis]MDQ0472982.1 hypothetical protein [Labrys wisconsinensis]
MLIATHEGQGWRYEVLAQSDGFLVQARDLDTGELAGEDVTLFRTATAALAFAGMSAAADRFAAARLDDEIDDEAAADFARECDHFATMRDLLSDEGVRTDASRWQRVLRPVYLH